MRPSDVLDYIVNAFPIFFNDITGPEQKNNSAFMLIYTYNTHLKYSGTASGGESYHKYCPNLLG